MGSLDDLREQYRLANQYRKLAFIERPYLGSPGAPAQDETNASKTWAHLNGGFLVGYEYTRWWRESRALRTAAVLGDWSWLNKVRVTGPDATAFLDRISVKDITRARIGQTLFTPMASEDGRIAIEGMTLKLGEDDYLFTQSGAQYWLAVQQERLGLRVTLDDETADWTCFALQGPRSLDILEAVTAEDFHDLRFSRWRRTELFGTEVIVQRQGVTGELGYEFLMRTGTGHAHELWRAIRTEGAAFGLRELGFKAQLVGHTESGIATVIRDYLPDRFDRGRLPRFAGLWMAPEEFAVLGQDLTEHLVTPAGLGWEHTVNFDRDGSAREFTGRDALAREADRGGPARVFRGLAWNADDVADLFAAQFRDAPAPPPPDLPWGQFRMLFLRARCGADQAGWASAVTYSPTLRRLISNARLDRTLAAGDEVTVDWGGPGAGGIAGEPTWQIRATVTEQPFIAHHRRADVGFAGVARDRSE
jgi:glycine cleavage system T protein (aminomethyltransferase)